MNTVREFAERVLFAETLEDKLAPPPAGGMEDVERGSAVLLPDMPGRPSELRISDNGVKVDFPGLSCVESDQERGKLLHFFANHELLATELMALVLLKFPDAPAEFRSGVLKTLKEEQMHTKLYLRRMRECGVNFGELPVSGFFWKLVAPMESPLDYVTRLSLTFEQANLDYSKAYAQVFNQSGDTDTASILERIYKDEINHVHYGLSWFRQWHQGKSEWKSFCSLLNEPLSATRAKGTVEFNEQGRRDAGLNEEFIRELKAFSKSRGRTPVVHWFNPGAEEELAGRPGRRAMNQVKRDLGLLMAFVARRDDVVVVDEVPPASHILTLNECGIEVPELLASGFASGLVERKLGGARPWAATPQEASQASEWGLEVSPTSEILFSKCEHARFLQRVIDAGGWNLLCNQQVIGKVVVTADELRDAVSGSPYNEWIIKSPISTAGRDRLRFLKDQIPDGLPDTLGEVALVEPWLDRVLDFSIQYDRVEDGRLMRRGMAVLNNTPGGQFHSAKVMGRLIDALPDSDRRKIFESDSSRGGLVVWLETVFEPLLVEWLGDAGYHGPLGVDAMFYRTPTGELRFKPVVEVNPRVTMGRVALELSRFAANHATSELIIQSIRKPSPKDAVRLTYDSPHAAFSAWWKVH